MATNNIRNRNFEEEYKMLEIKMKEAFNNLKIDEFLKLHHSISGLFTTKCQHVINGKNTSGVNKVISFDLQTADSCRKLNELTEKYEKVLNLKNKLNALDKK